MDIIKIITHSPCSVLSGALFAIMLLAKTRRKSAHVKNARARMALFIAGFIGIAGGMLGIIVLTALDQKWHMVDLAIGISLLGIAVIGLIAERSRDRSDSVL